MQGEIAINSLRKFKVDIDNIKIISDVRTRCFHVSYHEENDRLFFTSKKRCPFCNNKKWYDKSLLDVYYVISDIKIDDVLVFDNLNKKNQVIIDNTNNKKIIDLGQYFEFENMSNNEIVNVLKKKFEIINFNERVSNYLLKRLNLKNDSELYDVISPKLMTVTRGENGATFILDGNAYNFKLITKGEVIDSTGAGDAFISSIIKDAIKANFKYDSEDFEKWYKNSNELTMKVVSKMGARGHISPLFKIKKIDKICTCDRFSYTERKKITRCSININNLEKRIINAVNSSAGIKLDEIDFNKDINALFIGTGGSYAGSYFASRIINELYGCNTYSLYPRDVLYRNNRNINKVILFSYSGTTNDIITSIKDFDKKDVYLITKGELENIMMKTSILKKNILSYRSVSKVKESGFLSFEGAVAPAAIFLNYYLDKISHDIDINDFIRNSIMYWNKQIEKLVNKDLVRQLKKQNLINIFTGDYTNTACYDLESKIIESGVFNCIVHEKKNFSHGRFINYENQNNKYSIYFKKKETSLYEEELLKYLDKKNTIIIESNYNGFLAEFDLLIASQFIIYHIGKVLDIDVSKPKYSDDAMKIYFYSGCL